MQIVTFLTVFYWWEYSMLSISIHGMRSSVGTGNFLIYWMFMCFWRWHLFMNEVDQSGMWVVFDFWLWIWHVCICWCSDVCASSFVPIGLIPVVATSWIYTKSRAHYVHLWHLCMNHVTVLTGCLIWYDTIVFPAKMQYLWCIC